MNVLLVLAIFILAWSLQSKLYVLRTKKRIPETFRQRLEQLGALSLNSKDVPVGAILVYEDKIIGEGSNTIRSKGKLTGHAEMNALDDAFEKLGQDFFKLNRQKLAIYSSYEPCEMCKGALVQYNIKRVYFEGQKPLGMPLLAQLKSIYYELVKRRIRAKNLQKELFLRHPGYRAHHNLDQHP